MSTATPLDAQAEIEYPETDGLPMAENTVQYRLLTTIKGGLDILFANDPNVFVAGDLFWYPVEGSNTIRVAPDVLVVIGRPKGDRSSYMQWREDNIAPQVVFEILSPGNRHDETERKLEFYERYGVEECYFNDPEFGTLSGWQRVRGKWREVPNVVGSTSPRLKVRFELNNGEIELYGPDGERFKSIVEVAGERELAEARAREALARIIHDAVIPLHFRHGLLT